MSSLGSLNESFRKCTQIHRIVLFFHYISRHNSNINTLNFNIFVLINDFFHLLAPTVYIQKERERERAVTLDTTTKNKVGDYKSAYFISTDSKSM